MDRNLRIRMLLEASDRVTKPLRDIAGGSARASRNLKETRDRLRQLEDAQANLKSFRTLKMESRQTALQLGTAQSRVAELARAIEAADAPSKKLSRDFDNARRAAAALANQHDEQSAELQRLRSRMREAGLDAGGLVEHERRLRTEIQSTNGAIEDQSRRLTRAADRSRRFAAGRAKFSAVQNGATSLAAGGFSAVETGRAMGAPMLDTVSAAQEYQSAMTDIAQKADLTRVQGERMGATLLAAAQRANQLPAAMQSGVDMLMGFGLGAAQAEKMITPIGRAATAYKAEMADLSAAAFAVNDNLKVPVDQTARVIDAMAAAGKAGAFEMKDMAQYFPTLTAGYQALGQRGVGAVSDLAAALQIARKGAGDSATAATNVANVLQKISSPATTRAFKKYGVDLPAALKKAYAEGKTPLEAIAELTNKTLGGDMSKLGYLFEDAQVQQGLRPLIANLEEYRRIRAEAQGAGGTTDRDFAERMKDSAEQTKQFNASAQSLSITVGTMLLPTVNAVTAKAAQYAQRLSAWAKQNPALAKGIVFVGATLSALFIVLGGGAIAIAGLVAPVAALSAASAALGIGMLPLIGIVGGVVLVIAALAAAGYLIYTNWGSISAWFANLWAGIKAIFFKALDFVKGLFANFKPAMLLMGPFALIFPMLQSLVPRFVEMGRNLIQGLISGIFGMLGKLKSTIVNAASAAANWFKEKLGIHSPSRVFMGLGGFVMQGLDQGIRQGEREPVQRIDRLSKAMLAAMTITAPTIATAAPAVVAAAQPAPAASAAPIIINATIQIVQQPGESATDLAQRIKDALRDLERERAAGARASMRDRGDGDDA